MKEEIIPRMSSQGVQPLAFEEFNKRDNAWKNEGLADKESGTFTGIKRSYETDEEMRYEKKCRNGIFDIPATDGRPDDEGGDQSDA
mmetsp:Transcript_40216/g.84470  ORF Transcript_40216/g.84470 Transcript_40216/m.84470 type:complete len:86 (+) Transcript_40216:208-465(+)